MIRQKRPEYKVGEAKALLTSIDPMVVLSFLMLLAVCFYPEISLANSSVEGQLDKVGTLANGKVKTIGFSAAAICGGIIAVAKGNIKFAGIIIAVGVVMALYTEWISGGMKLMNAV